MEWLKNFGKNKDIIFDILVEMLLKNLMEVLYRFQDQRRIIGFRIQGIIVMDDFILVQKFRFSLKGCRIIR